MGRRMRADAPTEGSAPADAVAQVTPPRKRVPRLSVAKVVAILLGLVLVGVSSATASQLAVTVGKESTAQVMHKCASQTLAATVAGTASGTSYTSMQLSGIAAACQGAATTVELRGSGGTLLASGSVTPTGATATVATGSYTGTAVTTVVVKVRGWLYTAAWTPPTAVPALTCKPVNPAGNVVNGAGQSCTVTVTGISSWVSYPGQWGVGQPYYHYSFNFDVTSSMTQWEVTVNFANTTQFPLYNAVPVFVGTSYNLVNAPGYSCSSLPTYVARKAAGNVSWGNNAVLYVTSQPGATNGTTQLCP